MKRLFLSTLLGFYGATSLAQQPYKNKVFMGFSFFGDASLLNFASRGYPPGLGGTWTVLSPKITLSDSKEIWLRFGGAISAARQSRGTITIPNGYAKIKNSYMGLNLITRLSWEMKDRWRPFAEVAVNWNVFESQYSNHFTDNHTQIYRPPLFYNGSLPGLSLTGGYMYRITDGFLLETKLSYLQGFKQIEFARVDKVIQTNGDYSADVRSAIPSMLLLHVGIIFRLPPLTAHPSPQNPVKPPLDQPSSPKNKKPRKEAKYNYTW